MRRKTPGFETSAESFFSTHPVFRFEEFAKAYTKGGHSKTSVSQALAYHVSTGRLRNVRRGLYAVGRVPFDPCLLASKLHPEAALAYDGAAALHGLTAIEHQCCYLAPTHVPRFVHGEVVFRSIRDPAPYPTDFDTVRSISCTTLERTLVDCLDRLDFAPDVEDLYDGFLRSKILLEVDSIVDHVKLLKSAPAAMRVGLFLSAHPLYRNARAQLGALHKLEPDYTLFLTSNRDFGENDYWREWRINVPKRLSDRMYRIANAREPA